MQTLTQPTLLLKPFAESGDKNTLPDVNTDLSNPQNADLTNGFPQITSMKPSDGGLPPQREDFNALGYLTTAYDFFYQAGGTFTFDPTISTAIGGYPLGARLWYTDSNGVTMILRSTVQNNTDNFNDGNETGIGTTWVSDTPTLGGNNVWTGLNTFSGGAIVPTQASSDNSTKAASTAFVQDVASSYAYGATPRDKTTLFTGSGAITTNKYLQLTESWQNFEELVFVGASTSSSGNMTAFRLSTYWLNELLTEAGSSGDVMIWSNYIGSYLEVAGYTASTPSTTSDLYVNGHVNGYLKYVYGINRKPTP